MSVPIKCMARNFYPGGLRSGQFRGLPIISIWENMKMLPVSHKPNKTTQFFQDHGHSPHLCGSGCSWQSGVTGRSPEVKWRYNPFFANKSRRDADRDAQMVPDDLARRAASDDVRIDLLGSWSNLELTWGQIFKLTFQDQKVYVSNLLDEANTMASFLCCYLHIKKLWKTISAKNDNFLFDDLWSRNYWP